MSRLHEALQRASEHGQTAAHTPIAAVGEDALTQFVAGGQAVDDLSDVVDESGNPQWAPTEESVNTRSESGQSALVVRPIPGLPVTVARQDSHQDIRIRDVLQVLSRRWTLVAGIVAASLVLVAVYNSVATPIYEARARLIILDPEARQVVPFRQETEAASRVDYYLTQLEVLRSRGLARMTLERLHLLSGNEARQSV